VYKDFRFTFSSFLLQVMVQVSCEVTVPKETRPNEGSIMVNVELSPMAAPHFEAGRPSDESVCYTYVIHYTSLMTFLITHYDYCFLQCND